MKQKPRLLEFRHHLRTGRRTGHILRTPTDRNALCGEIVLTREITQPAIADRLCLRCLEREHELEDAALAEMKA